MSFLNLFTLLKLKKHAKYLEFPYYKKKEAICIYISPLFVSKKLYYGCIEETKPELFASNIG